VAATGVAAVLTVMLMLSIGFGQLDTSMAPTLIMQLQLLDHLAPAHRLNEAQAFLSASNTTGAAVGTAIAGIVIDTAGLPWSFGGAALGALFAAGVALRNQSRWRTSLEGEFGSKIMAGESGVNRGI
jgi:predicted MFS family arabinose efflux permease